MFTSSQKPGNLAAVKQDRIMQQVLRLRTQCVRLGLVVPDEHEQLVWQIDDLLIDLQLKLEG
jgi:hypothetical protein